MKHVTSQFKDNLVRKTHSKCLCTIDIWRLVIFWSYSSNEEIIAMQTWLRRSYIAKSMGCYFVERMDFGGRKRRARNMGLFNLSYLLFISKNPSKHPSMILIHNPSSSNYKALLVVRPLTKKTFDFKRNHQSAGSQRVFLWKGFFLDKSNGPTHSLRRWMQWLLLFGELSKLSG